MKTLKAGFSGHVDPFITKCFMMMCYALMVKECITKNNHTVVNVIDVNNLRLSAASIHPHLNLLWL